MKNFCSPLHTSRRNNHTSKLTQVRAALFFSLVIMFSCLPFYVLAQNDAGSAKAKASPAYVEVPDSAAFVIYQGPNGDTVCRDATKPEARELMSGTSRFGLRQINHLQDKTSSSNAGESVAGITIILHATAQLNANPEAKQAFINAAAKWEALIQDPVTINVDVDFGTTFFGTPFPGPMVIGATGTRQYFSPGNYSDVRQRLINHATGSEVQLMNNLVTNAVPTDLGNLNTVFVAGPLLRALGVTPPDNNDGRIGFNSAFGFDFDPSDGITGNLTDFDAVAVHEMGHLLGFNSAVGERELDPSSPLALSVWDLFRFRPGTANLNNFGTAQRILSSGGTQVQFNGGSELGLSTGKPDGTGGDGEQASHWKDDEQNGGNFIGIMDPTIRRNTREVMTANDQSAIDSFGYTITPTTPPPNDAFVNGQVITGINGSLNGTNVFASKEAGEPSHSPDGNPGGKSVWYRWTAPSSGVAFLNTIGSTYDTLLAVYTGSSVSTLTPIVKNDDSGAQTTSAVQFNAVGGTTYQIAVDGFDGDQGSITLNYNLPAPNSAIQFASATGTVAENAGSAVISVTRTGDLSGSVSVNYFTSDGTATSFDQDYSSLAGQLNFASGETSKNIIVSINNDTTVEPNETFNVGLGSPTNGAALGTPSSTIVTITDNDAPPNTAQFSAGTATVTETAAATTKVDLLVTRTGNTSAAATVNYATSDGTASERSDYLAALGTLRFAAGEGSKTITVFIVNDSFGESPETFNVTLTNPVSCTLGSATSVLVTIGSDETVTGPNPVKDPTFDSDLFVREQYVDFLNREPDASGLAFWKNQIDECTTPNCREIRRINVSAAFFLSIEFQQTGYLVYKTNQAAFNSGEFLKLREFLSDTQEIGRGVVIGQPGADALLEANKARFFNDFVQRPAFMAAFPTTMTAFEFVNKLNANTFDPNNPGSGGALTTGERDAIVFQLSFAPTAAGARAQALRSVAENALFNTRQSNKAFVLMQYFGYLRRNPNDPPELNLDFGGYNFWLGKLNQFNGNFVNAEMVKAFIVSGEYQGRFGP